MLISHEPASNRWTLVIARRVAVKVGWCCFTSVYESRGVLLFFLPTAAIQAQLSKREQCPPMMTYLVLSILRYTHMARFTVAREVSVILSYTRIWVHTWPWIIYRTEQSRVPRLKKLPHGERMEVPEEVVRTQHTPGSVLTDQTASMVR